MQKGDTLMLSNFIRLAIKEAAENQVGVDVNQPMQTVQPMAQTPPPQGIMTPAPMQQYPQPQQQMQQSPQEQLSTLLQQLNITVNAINQLVFGSPQRQ